MKEKKNSKEIQLLLLVMPSIFRFHPHISSGFPVQVERIQFKKKKKFSIATVRNDIKIF